MSRECVGVVCSVNCKWTGRVRGGIQRLVSLHHFHFHPASPVTSPVFKGLNRIFIHHNNHSSHFHRNFWTNSYKGLLLSSTSSKKEQEPNSSDSGNPNPSDKDKDPTSKALTTQDFFTNLHEKNKESFIIATEVFIERDKHLRGHVEFIYSALKHMKEFGVHRDLEVYKKIIDVFPKGRFIPTNMFQVEFMHFPKQQQCGVDLLEQMEMYFVMPDAEMEQMLVNIFGSQGFPLRKLRRMLYWMPKFKNLSPWPLPDTMPNDSLELAKMAIQRITTPDLQTRITCLNAMDLPDSTDPTWIVSGQSPVQQKLIEQLPSDRPVYVEGAFRLWMRNVCMNYFILRAEPKKLPEKQETDPDDVGFLSSIFEEDYEAKEVATIPSVHEQDDGIILAVCATGTSSRDSILSWIRFLEESNPRLGTDISVLFTLKSPLGPTDDLDITEQVSGSPENTATQTGSLDKDSKEKPKILIDPVPENPELSQIGIGADSETRFPNWPHHFNRAGASGTGVRKSIDSHHSKKQEFLKNIQKLKDEVDEINRNSNKSYDKKDK